METVELIRILARTARPVKRLPSPGLRVLVWLTLSLAYAGAVLLAVGARPDIAEKLGETRFLVETGAAFATAVLAAMAAFCASCPGHLRLERLAPLPALLLWLASLGKGSWEAWVQAGPNGHMIAADLLCFSCFLGILLISAVPGALTLAMIRQGAPMAPAVTMALAALAVTSLGVAVLRLLDPQDASMAVLVWQFGSVVLLSALGALSGRWLLRWPEPAVAWGGAQARTR